MPASVLNNRYNTVLLHASGANATFTIAGNNSVSNVATGSQVLTGGSITRIWYGCGPSGYWNVKRGANLLFSFESSGTFLFDGAGVGIDKTATLVLELIGTANGFVMVEMRKEGQIQ